MNMMKVLEAHPLSSPTVPGYTLFERLGEGGMGVVWRARADSSDRDVALKLLSHGSDGGSSSRRFRREFRAAARLRHPHVAEVLDIHAGAPLFYTMELVRGLPLDQALAPGPEGLLEPARVDRIRALTAQILVALEVVHAGDLVHRDLKPANLLVAQLGPDEPLGFEPPQLAAPYYAPCGAAPRPLVKLLDFGLAWQRDQSGDLTQTGMIVGTIDYISPEQVLGGEVDARADLYALGVVLYELLAGRPPFHAADTVALLLKHAYETPMAPGLIQPGVDPALEALALRLLAKEPADRFPSAREALRALADDGRCDDGRREDGRRSQHSALRPAPRTPGLLPPRLVGRDAPLALARQALHEVREAGSDAGLQGSGCATLLIAGEAGIGKSRVLEEIKKTARMLGFAVHAGSAHDEQGYALAPLLTLLDGLAREAESLPREPALSEAARVLAHIIPRFRALVIDTQGAESTFAPVAFAANADEERFRVLSAVAEVVRRLAGVRPLALFVEDIHWADPLTLDLLAYLRRDSSPSLLLAVTLREEDAEPGSPAARLRDAWRRDGALEIRLARLVRVELEAMVRSMLGAGEAPEELVSWLHAESQGVPFLAIEHLTAFAAEGALLAVGAGRLGLRRRLSGEIAFPRELPPTVAELVRRRIAKLPERERKVAGLAALVGPEVPFDLLHAAAAMPEDELLDALQILLRRGILVEARDTPDLFLFPAKVLRDVLAEDLFERRRRRAHERIAIALSARPQRRPEDVVALARHTWLAGDRRAAAGWLIAASDLHVQRLDHSEALAAARKAIEAIDAEPDAAPGPATRAELWLRVAEMEILLCVYERADEAFAQVLLAAPSAGAAAVRLRARAALGLAEVALRRGEYGDADARTSEGLALAQEGGDSEALGRAQTSLGRIAWHRGLVEQSVAAFSAALAIAGERGDEAEQAKALHNLGYAAFARGDYADAERRFTQGLTACRARGNPLGVARALEALGAVRQRRGGYAQAEAELGEARALMHRAGDRRGEAYCVVSLGNLAAFRGDWLAAMSHYDEAEETFAELGELRGASFCVANRGRALTALGDYGTALEQLGFGLKLARRIDERGEIADCQFGLAELFRDACDFEEAAREDENVVAALRELGDRHGLGLALTGAAATAFGQGRAAAALELAAQALAEVGSAGGMPEVEARARLVMAAARSDVAGAATAAEVAEGAGLAELAVLARALEARLATGDSGHAARARAAAQAGIDALARPLGSRQEAFLRRISIRAALES